MQIVFGNQQEEVSVSWGTPRHHSDVLCCVLSGYIVIEVFFCSNAVETKAD